jgi:RHS repeat-associated protein
MAGNGRRPGGGRAVAVWLCRAALAAAALWSAAPSGADGIGQGGAHSAHGGAAADHGGHGGIGPKDRHGPGRTFADGRFAGVAIHAGRGLAVVAEERLGHVRLLSLPSGKAVATVEVGRGPRRAAIDGERDLAVVTLREENAVAFVDLEHRRRVALARVGRAPEGIALDAQAGIAAVINRGDDSISIVGLDARRTLRTIRVGRDPAGVAFQAGEGLLWVTLEKGDAVELVDPNSGAIVRSLPAVRRPVAVAVDGGLGVAAVLSGAAGGLDLVDVDTLGIRGHIDLGRGAVAMAVDPASDQAFVVDRDEGCVMMIDLGTMQIVGRLAAGRHPADLAVDGSLRLAVVSGETGIRVLHLPDTRPPVIQVGYPPQGLLTNRPELTVIGSVDKPAAVTVAGKPVTLDPARGFSRLMALDEGRNDIDIVAIAANGRRSSLTVTVFLDTEPPPGADRDLIAVSESAGEVTFSGEPGSVEPRSRVTARNLRSGETTSTLADAAGAFVLTVVGQPGDSYAVALTDEAGNEGSAISFTPFQPPADPASVAPPLDASEATRLFEATAFLYQGPNAVQRGMVPGAIDARRVAVLRGRVLDRIGVPLAGVAIDVAGHPEFGQTLTRADGAYDLAVNGGGDLVVRYRHEGFLPLQRRIGVPWQDYHMLPDVGLTRLDGQVTIVDLGLAAPMAVARGGAVTDASGSRQATLLFSAGTTARLVLADGTVRTVDRLAVRATEYSVGEDGPRAMPGELPPDSGYTYAVELSADEALAAGAREVRFDRPVRFYVENFLGLPVGGAVPAGWYDREHAAWMPSLNGRIVRILSVEAGLASVDVDGSGQPASDAAVAALGIDDDERRALATLYAPGQALWRVSLDHFTPWDLNWPYGPPKDARPPAMPPPRADDVEEEPDCRKGSIIECQNQVLGESIPIAGTPFTLNYRSDRVPGRTAAYTLDVALSGASMPASLRRIELTIDVAGRRFRETFAPGLNLRHRFSWDGRDGFGRTVQGVQKATVRVGYVYPAIYYQPAEFERSFAVAGSAPISGNPGRQEVTLSQQWVVPLGVLDARAAGLGGWTLDVQHLFDPAGMTLYHGRGARRSAQGIGAIIHTVAGSGEAVSNGDGGSATVAGLSSPLDVAQGADGSLYFSESHRIRRVDRDGVVSTVAGNGGFGFAGDGGPATQATVRTVFGLALDAEGNLYFADAANHRIRRVGRDGIIATVAGSGGTDSGNGGFAGDGGPATQARLNSPRDVALGADGSLYIADADNGRIRRVGPGGDIVTVAGSGASGFAGDGGPATQAQLRGPSGVAVAPDGTLYIADRLNYRVRRVTPDGVITTVAGTGVAGFSGDGGPAIQAQMFPIALALDRDGNLLISDGGRRIRRVSPDGVIVTVAGNGSLTFSGDGGLATQAGFGSVEGLSVGLDGGLYVADVTANRIRRIGPRLGRDDDGSVAIASEDGERHVFDDAGRHLRSEDGVSGALRHRLVYEAGRLSGIEDADGDVTRIERDGSGRPLAIVAPGGRRTALELDANGYLAAVTDPMGEPYRMAYTAGGLLTGFTDPRQQTSRYAYDEAGRLARSEDAAGGGWLLTRVSADGGEAIMVSAEGHTTRYRMERSAAGDRLRANTYADGTIDRFTIGADGVRTRTRADGTVFSARHHPDPRFGMDLAYADVSSIRTPGGRTLSLTAERSAVSGDPADPLGPAELGYAVTLNGRIHQAHYDPASRSWSETTPEGRREVSVLDDRGRLSRRQIDGLEASSYLYDAHGRLSALVTGERSVGFGYDAHGDLAALTDALARTTAFERDAAGRVTRQTLADGRDIRFEYDAGGNLVSLVAPGGAAHVFAYSPVGLGEAYHAPVLAGEPAVTRYEYNLDRQLSRIERPGGEAVALDYDAGGRIAAIHAPPFEYAYDYEPSTGRLKGIAASGAETLAFEWDGFLPVAETWSGEVSGAIARLFDDDLRLQALAVDGQPVSFAYDGDGLLVQAGGLALTRDPRNGLVGETRLGDVVTRLAYNGFGETMAASAAIGSRTAAQFAYVRDALGRVTARDEVFDDATVAERYDYDAAGRLVAVTHNGVITTWGYDANGNRTHVDGVQVAFYDARDRLLRHGDVTYDYASGGELRAKSRAGVATTYRYDAFGNLRGVELPAGTAIEYVIDGRQRRVGKKVDGVLVQGFLYDGESHVVAELDGAGNPVARFIYGDRSNVPAYMIRGERRYRIVSDHLGSPRLVVDADSGETVQRIDYDAWGRVLRDTRPGFQPFGFAGGLYDRDTGLVRFGARDYDPETGRWTSQDSLLFRGGDFNLYGYALGDPINLLDADGRLVLNAVGAVVGAALGGYQAYRQGGNVAGGILFGFYGSLIISHAVVNAAIGFLGNLAGQTLDPCLEEFNWTAAATAGALGALGLGKRLPWQPNLLSNTEIVAHETMTHLLGSQLVRIAGGAF